MVYTTKDLDDVEIELYKGGDFNRVNWLSKEIATSCWFGYE